jgi:HK97 family phage major capsid protein
MNRYEKRKKAIEKAIGEHIAAYQAIYKKANDEDREPADDERLDVEHQLKQIEILKVEKEEIEANIKTMQHVDDLGRQLGSTVEGSSGGLSFETSVGVVPGGNPVDRMVKSLGQQFVEAKSVQEIHERFKSGERGRFNTGSIELKATLLEGTGAPGSGTGGGLIPVPQVIPGVVEKLFQPLRIRELILDGSANTSSLRYVVEGTATSGAAGVAEGGSKPQSTLALSTKDMPVTKVATSMKVSDEMLEDVQQVQSYINGRLSLFIDIEEERQIVLGAGSGSNELAGIAGAGVNAYGRGTVDNNAVALFKAMNGQRGSAFMEPDWVVMNPANWQTTRLMTDSTGQFQGGGPFLGQYGNGQNLQASGQITGVNDIIWNKPVVVTTAIGAGTALVGTRAAAQLWLRGGLSVEATNANEDDFLHNLVAIRAEKREALTVYRPAAFTLVSGLS